MESDTIGASDRANITCPMHDTRISQIDNIIQVIKRNMGLLFHTKMKMNP